MGLCLLSTEHDGGHERRADEDRASDEEPLPCAVGGVADVARGFVVLEDHSHDGVEDDRDDVEKEHDGSDADEEDPPGLLHEALERGDGVCDEGERHVERPDGGAYYLEAGAGLVRGVELVGREALVNARRGHGGQGEYDPKEEERAGDALGVDVVFLKPLEAPKGGKVGENKHQAHFLNCFYLS